MFKKIMVLQDGSDFDKSAMEYGAFLAKSFDGELIGVHVIDIVKLEGSMFHDLSGSLAFEPFLNFTSKMRELLESNGNIILENFTEECKNLGVKSSTEVLSGVVVREVCEKASLVDLIVMGKRGTDKGFEFGLLGSVTEGVIRKSPKPVMVVGEEFSEIKNPMLAFDLSESASNAMANAAEVASSLGVGLTVVASSKGAEASKALKESEEYLKPYKIEVTVKELLDEPAVAIENYYKENGFDLIFMGKTHHGALMEMVLGSTTEHVVRNVSGPVFIVR